MSTELVIAIDEVPPPVLEQECKACGGKGWVENGLTHSGVPYCRECWGSGYTTTPLGEAIIWLMIHHEERVRNRKECYGE